MALVLPPAVRGEMEARAHGTAARALNRDLNAHDPELSVVWVKSDIPEWEIPENVIPGRWHVKNSRPCGVGLPPTYTAIAHPDGSYREPDSSVLREMQMRDSQRRGGLRELLDRAHAPTEKQKGMALHREQRLDEAKEDFRAAKRVAGENVHKRNWGKGGVAGS